MEIKSLDEKLELLKEFNKTFGNVLKINFDELFNMFPIDQILDSKFETEILKYMTGDAYSGFIKLFNDNSAYHNFIAKKPAQSDINALIQKIFNLVALGKIDKDMLPSMPIIVNNRDQIFAKIINDGLAPAFLKRGTNNYQSIRKFLIETLDQFLVKCNDFSLIEKTYDIVTKAVPDYVNFPIVIINKALTLTQKISVIKKTYIQKDITKYMDFLRKNLVDIKDLDAFIEATIIQNNRVREKENRIREVFRRIFFGLRGDYSDLHMDKYENFDIVKTKYKKYFTDNAIKVMYNQVDNYTIRSNVTSFIFLLFENDSFEEKIKKATVLPSYGERIVKNIDTTFKEIKGDEKKEKLFFTYIASKLGLEEFTNSFADCYKYINKYPDVFKTLLSTQATPFSDIGRWDYEDHFSFIEKLYDQLSNTTISYINFVPNNVLSCLFIGVPNADYNGNRAENLNRKVKFLFANYDRFISKNSYYKEFFYDNIFKYYEDSDITNSIVLQITSESLKDRDTFRILKNYTGTTSDTDAIGKFIQKFIDIINKYYPTQIGLLENFNKLKIDLQLLSSF